MIIAPLIIRLCSSMLRRIIMLWTTVRHGFSARVTHLTSITAHKLEQRQRAALQLLSDQPSTAADSFSGEIHHCGDPISPASGESVTAVSVPAPHLHEAGALSPRHSGHHVTVTVVNASRC
jgi:hypothetical protein